VRAFKLPEVFWHDLADIVSLMTLGLQAELQPGHQSYDELSSFIDRVNELLEWSRKQPGWTEFNRLRVEFAVGTGLCSRVKNLHQKDDLKKAIHIFRSSRLRPKGSSTSEWSAFQETVGQTVFFSARELAEADRKSNCMTSPPPSGTPNGELMLVVDEAVEMLLVVR
jgi:hypothetical protein